MPVRSETMSAITQCPECGTCFKVSQEQLEVRHGLVRCGRCQAVFNATAHLHDDQPSPQLDLPIMHEEVPTPSASTSDSAPEKHEEQVPVGEATIPFAALTAEPQPPAEMAAIEQEEAAKPATLAQPITLAEGALEHHLAVPKKKKRKRRWPWFVGCLLLLILMLTQAAYFFRIELAARLPGFKPALMSYCALLKCSIPLPHKIDLISIESSELEADPAHANVITLNAILRNHAPYAQAYPDLELTFTDTQDNLVGRRTFKPGNYLKPYDNENQGMPPNREVSVKLHLDTTDLKPTGYRLFLYYP
ncbi:hypothetical protein RHDC2_00772 [Rhodocyclaceae bacterium]|nr:hypothetical protein RHDC2_00772 [Rhodocyclaceae bacterium]